MPGPGISECGAVIGARCRPSTDAEAVDEAPNFQRIVDEADQLQFELRLLLA
jgi:hypothetical protein